MGATKEAGEEQKDKAWNVYMDFRKPLRKAFIVFFAQFGLFMYYLFELNGESTDDDSPGRDAHHPNNVSMVKWFFAVALLLVAGDSEVGPSFGSIFWRDKLDRAFRGTCCGIWCGNCRELKENKELDTDCCCCLPSCLSIPSFCCSPRLHILCRLFWDFMINAVARVIICGTAPIMLCVEGPLDFVKDATAVFFIIKLDDVEDDAYLSETNTWNPILKDSHYEITVANDHIYKIAGLRKLLGFPSVETVLDEWDANPEKKHLVFDCEQATEQPSTHQLFARPKAKKPTLQMGDVVLSELQRVHGGTRQVTDEVHEDRQQLRAPRTDSEDFQSPRTDSEDFQLPVCHPELSSLLARGYEIAMSMPVPDSDEDL